MLCYSVKEEGTVYLWIKERKENSQGQCTLKDHVMVAPKLLEEEKKL